MLADEVRFFLSPYGEAYGGTGTQQTVFGYSGEPNDSNGLLHLRSRYYNPTIGQFFSRDPLKGDMGNPLSLNRYLYVQGNVVNAVDPSGMILERPPMGCMPQQQQTTQCSGSQNYLLPVDYSSRFVDDSYAHAPDMNAAEIWGGQMLASNAGLEIAIQKLADAAEAAGNVHGAANFRHWLEKTGAPMNDYPVEQMITDLRLWRDDITEVLNTSVTDIPGYYKPIIQAQGCNIYQVYFGDKGTTPLWAGKKPTWRRVGKGSGDETAGKPRRHTEKEIYSGGDNINMNIGGKDFPSLTGPIPAGASYTRQEFDWFIAMNAFDYAISVAMALDPQSGDTEICYRIDIADEYVWYEALGGFDAYMARAEEQGAGKGYEIRGSSKVRCERFNQHDIAPDPQYNGTRTPKLKGPQGN